MNFREKVYQLFILGTDGNGIDKAIDNGLGGIIFFSRDIESAIQFKRLIKKYKAQSKHTLLFSIDQEGGRVERTENIHHGKKYLSAKFAFEKDILKEQTENIAQELKSFGINLNFAPCIDVNTNPSNPIIGERAFSSNVDDVIKASKIVIDTYLANGIIPCVKHFPGHGDANTDSHLTLPEINLSLDEMEKTHIKPFANTKNCPMLMVAHLHCSCFDKEIIPTSMSKNALSYLRKTIGYKGIAITDDMIMNGVKGFSPEIALKAGIDMFIYRNSTPETINIIENLIKNAETDNELKTAIETAFKRKKSVLNPFFD